MSDQVSVSSLESEIEQTRQHLAATIDQLVYRASPKTIAKSQNRMPYRPSKAC